LQEILLYHLFRSLNEEKSLTAQGIGAYLQMQELLADGSAIQTYEDLVFACETLLVKDKNEQAQFRAIVDNWTRQIKEYASAQFHFTHPDPKPDVPLPAPEPPSPDLPEPPLDDPRNDPRPPDPKTPPAPDPSKPSQPQPPAPDPDVTEPQPADGEISFSFGNEETTGDSKKIQETGLDHKATASRTFLFGNEYFPVGSRYLWQNWRNLRSRQHTSEYAGIDLQATIRKIAYAGRFTEFALEHKTRNLISLFILLDQGGSMTAYEAFGEELVESARASGAHPDLTPLYFHNLPAAIPKKDDYYFFSRDQTNYWTTNDLFKNPNKKDICILIYSDAGALRGTTGQTKNSRVDETKKFLEYLLKNTAHIVWLNPAPANRWANTAAAQIARLFNRVPMFEASPGGMEQAIHVLKGKPVSKK
jgi:hypothetical protein